MRRARSAERGTRNRDVAQGAAQATEYGHSAFRVPRSAFALFLGFLGFYLLTASGHFYTGDEETLYLATEGLVERGSLALPAGTWGIHLRRTEGVDGALYSQYPPGQSLAAVPLYLLGRTVAPLFPDDARGYVTRFFVGTFGAVVAALTVALLYRLARALGYRRGVALGLAAIYGLATLAWPYSRTFFAEPLCALLLLAAFAAIQRGTDRMRRAEYGVRNGDGLGAPPQPGARPYSVFRTPLSAFVLSGAAATAAVATKPHAAIALPVLALYLLGRAAAPAEGGVGWGDAARRVGRALLAWGVGLALVAVPYAAFNTALYGGPFQTGYTSASPELSFDTPWLRGLYGLTVSTGKGLLWYAPPVLLALAGWPAFLRRHRAEALACLGVVLVHLGFYSRYSMWHGDGSWGPRFLVIALPFAILPLAGLLEGVGASRVRAAVVAVVVALGVGVQLLGTLVNLNWYLPHYPDAVRHFDPPASPLRGHARILAQRADEWRARAFPPRDTAFLSGGFRASEGDPVDDVKPLLPRWTDGAGELRLHGAAGESVALKLIFFAHRPGAEGREPPAVLVNGAPPPEEALERRSLGGEEEGWVYQLAIPAAAFERGPATVTLRSDTWNPQTLGVSDRDEELGVFVHAVEVWGARGPWRVREGLAIGPMPAAPGPRDRWFNNEGARHHLADLWAWYAAVAGFGRTRATVWIAAYAAVAGALFAAGLILFLRSLPAGAVRHALRRSRGQRHGARIRHTAGSRPLAAQGGDDPRRRG